jgi:hypothetical protein
VEAVRNILLGGLWVDRVIYPLAGVALVVSVVWVRRLWRNSLYSAAWVMLGGQAAFLFRRMDDFAPRYFLVMVMPLIVIVVLAAWEMRVIHLKAAWVMGGVLAVGFVMDVVMLGSFLHRRTFDLYNASAGIRKIVLGDATRKPLLLGISGSEISLMTGIPSVNDTFGTMSLADRVRAYQPGWYVVWVGIGPEQAAVLEPEYRMVKVASYPAFDDDERNVVVLYRMERRLP